MEEEVTAQLFEAINADRNDVVRAIVDEALSRGVLSAVLATTAEQA